MRERERERESWKPETNPHFPLIIIGGGIILAGIIGLIIYLTTRKKHE